ncbi:MAG: hypothetical protein IPK69_05330 [Phycisphaerales bacterium]|nr:MAG: hypothetical protein IPK69_05330 [Phycisphaerales bacterium]
MARCRLLSATTRDGAPNVWGTRVLAILMFVFFALAVTTCQAGSRGTLGSLRNASSMGLAVIRDGALVMDRPRLAGDILVGHVEVIIDVEPEGRYHTRLTRRDTFHQDWVPQFSDLSEAQKHMVDRPGPIDELFRDQFWTAARQLTFPIDSRSPLATTPNASIVILSPGRGWGGARVRMVLTGLAWIFGLASAVALYGMYWHMAEVQRVGKGLCPRCLYPLNLDPDRGDSTPACTECGWDPRGPDTISQFDGPSVFTSSERS